MTRMQALQLFLSTVTTAVFLGLSTCAHVPTSATSSNTSVTPPVVIREESAPAAADGGGGAADTGTPPPAALHKPAYWRHFVPQMLLRGDIGDDTASSVEALVAAVNDSQHQQTDGGAYTGDRVEAVVLVLDTRGGEVQAGARIVAALTSLRVPLVCVVSDQAYSMGTYTLEAACPVRLITDTGSLMLHEPYANGTVSLQNPNRWTFSTQAEAQRVVGEGWLRVVAQRLHLTLQALLSRLATAGGEWWMSADDALRARAVDAIVRSPAADVLTPLRDDLRLPARLHVALQPASDPG